MIGRSLVIIDGVLLLRPQSCGPALTTSTRPAAPRIPPLSTRKRVCRYGQLKLDLMNIEASDTLERFILHYQKV